MHVSAWLRFTAVRTQKLLLLPPPELLTASVICSFHFSLMYVFIQACNISLNRHRLLNDNSHHRTSGLTVTVACVAFPHRHWTVWRRANVIGDDRDPGLGCGHGRVRRQWRNWCTCMWSCSQFTLHTYKLGWKVEPVEIELRTVL